MGLLGLAGLFMAIERGLTTAVVSSFFLAAAVVLFVAGSWFARQPRRRWLQAEHAAALASRVRLDEAIDQIIGQHMAALVVQRMKLTTRDPYGNEIRDRWFTEVEYFRDRVLSPGLSEALSPDELAAASRILFSTRR